MSARGLSLHGRSAGDAADHARRTTLCVLLTDDDGPVPARVHAEIAARQWQTVETHNPLDAMLRLCLTDRTQATRTAWGLPRLQDLALLLCSEGRSPAIAHLAEAVRRHLPAVAIWYSIAGGRLETMNGTETGTAADSAPRDHRAETAAAGPASQPSTLPPLRAPSPSIEVARVHHNTRDECDETLPADSAAVHGEPGPPASDTVEVEDVAITRQEIAMLLEAEPDETAS